MKKAFKKTTQNSSGVSNIIVAVSILAVCSVVGYIAFNKKDQKSNIDNKLLKPNNPKPIISKEHSTPQTRTSQPRTSQTGTSQQTRKNNIPYLLKALAAGATTVGAVAAGKYAYTNYTAAPQTTGSYTTLTGATPAFLPPDIRATPKTLFTPEMHNNMLGRRTAFSEIVHKGIKTRKSKLPEKGAVALYQPQYGQSPIPESGAVTVYQPQYGQSPIPESGAVTVYKLPHGQSPVPGQSPIPESGAVAVYQPQYGQSPANGFSKWNHEKSYPADPPYGWITEEDNDVNTAKDIVPPQLIKKTFQREFGFTHVNGTRSLNKTVTLPGNSTKVKAMSTPKMSYANESEYTEMNAPGFTRSYVNGSQWKNGVYTEMNAAGYDDETDYDQDEIDKLWADNTFTSEMLPPVPLNIDTSDANVVAHYNHKNLLAGQKVAYGGVCLTIAGLTTTMLLGGTAIIGAPAMPVIVGTLVGSMTLGAFNFYEAVELNDEANRIAFLRPEIFLPDKSITKALPYKPLPEREDLNPKIFDKSIIKALNMPYKPLPEREENDNTDF